MSTSLHKTGFRVHLVVRVLLPVQISVNCVKWSFSHKLIPAESLKKISSEIWTLNCQLITYYGTTTMGFFYIYLTWLDIPFPLDKAVAAGWNCANSVPLLVKPYTLTELWWVSLTYIRRRYEAREYYSHFQLNLAWRTLTEKRMIKVFTLIIGYFWHSVLWDIKFITITYEHWCSQRAYTGILNFLLLCLNVIV